MSLDLALYVWKLPPMTKSQSQEMKALYIWEYCIF